MNKTPSILVDTGFEVDQNGALTEIVIPSVVATLNAPRKVVFNGTALNYIPSTTAALQEIEAPNLLALQSQLSGYNNLTSAKFDSVQTIVSGTNYQGTFRGCTSLVSVYLPELVSITVTATSEAAPFYNCSALVNVTMPNLTTVSKASGLFGGVFVNCTGLKNLTLPKISTIDNGFSAATGMCSGCTGLETVQLGSDGNPVTSIGNYTFGNCTQSGLTITIYTSGGAALSGSPWGATNATIEYEEA